MSRKRRNEKVKTVKILRKEKGEHKEKNSGEGGKREDWEGKA